jgi:hypothetical protein
LPKENIIATSAQRLQCVRAKIPEADIPDLAPGCCQHHAHQPTRGSTNIHQTLRDTLIPRLPAKKIHCDARRIIRLELKHAWTNFSE